MGRYSKTLKNKNKGVEFLKKNNSNAIDMIAKSIIRKYDKGLLTSEPDEVPLEEIIEFGHGLKIAYLDLSKDKLGKGMPILEDCIIPVYNKNTNTFESFLVSEGTIVVDKFLKEEGYEKEYRYVLAKNFASWLIHHNYCPSLSETKSVVELEAKLLALSLLMPKCRLKLAFDELDSKLKTEITIQILSDIFNVTIQKLGDRLEHMNILKLKMEGSY